MKPLLPLLLVLAAPLLAETVTLKESVLLKAERTAISLKPGTEVELVARDADTVTIKYRNLTGKIPASKLEGAAKPAEAPKAEEKKPAGQTPGGPQPATVPRPPQTTYGKAVQKAKDNAAAHEKNAVKPTDEILEEKK
ncbi:MAG: hypothetical protein PSW75_00095 [bacterium]|nr:hypothetical protein [bacterium]MDI1335315.1 hypothetical protein [Lacunisphaera sp.]